MFNEPTATNCSRQHSQTLQTYNSHKAIVDTRLWPGSQPACYKYLLVSITEQNLVRMDAWVLAVTLFRNTRDVRRYEPLRDSMTSSTRPQALQRHHDMVTGNMQSFSQVVSEICEWTDRQTDKHAHHNSFHASRRWNEYQLTDRVRVVDPGTEWLIQLRFYIISETVVVATSRLLGLRKKQKYKINSK